MKDLEAIDLRIAQSLLGWKLELAPEDDSEPGEKPLKRWRCPEGSIPHALLRHVAVRDRRSTTGAYFIWEWERPHWSGRLDYAIELVQHLNRGDILLRFSASDSPADICLRLFERLA